MSALYQGPSSTYAENGTQPVGEVIEAATGRFVAQCPRERLHAPPVFGSFVKVLPPGTASSARQSAPPAAVDPFADPPAPGSGRLPDDTPDQTLYAIVFAASTCGAEPGRRAAAYGLDEEQLQTEQPQIFDLLATQFEALHVGYAETGRLRACLPPRPPRLHAFVWECSEEEVCTLTDAPELLRRIVANIGAADADQLIVACLRFAYECRRQDFAFLVRAGKQLANLLRDDPERLTALLRNLEP